MCVRAVAGKVAAGGEAETPSCFTTAVLVPGTGSGSPSELGRLCSLAQPGLHKNPEGLGEGGRFSSCWLPRILAAGQQGTPVMEQLLGASPQHTGARQRAAHCSFTRYYVLRESHYLGQLACKDVSQILIETLSKLPPTEATGHTLYSTEPNCSQLSDPKSLIFKKHTLRLLFQRHNLETLPVCLLHIYF